MPDCNLDQLSKGDRFSKLMHEGFVVIPDFLENREASQLLGPVMQLLSLLEMESKFGIRRPRHAADILTRVDKFLDFNLQQVEGNQELQHLKQLARL